MQLCEKISFGQRRKPSSVLWRRTPNNRRKVVIQREEGQNLPTRKKPLIRCRTHLSIDKLYRAHQRILTITPTCATCKTSKLCNGRRRSVTTCNQSRFQLAGRQGHLHRPFPLRGRQSRNSIRAHERNIGQLTHAIDERFLKKPILHNTSQFQSLRRTKTHLTSATSIPNHHRVVRSNTTRRHYFSPNAHICQEFYGSWR